MPSDSARNALLALVILAGLSLLLSWFPGQSPLQIAVEQRLSPPSADHLLGTDDLGRDVLSRVVAGTALTLWVSMAALLSSLGIGILLGAVAGFWYNRWPDRLFCWLADALISVPFLLLVAALLSVTGPGLVKAYAVLTCVIWVSPARIVRAEVIKTWPLDYVSAERALGVPNWKVLFATVLPACVNTAVLFSLGYLPEIIALEAGLSFLGLGVQPPQPSLGKMVFDGINYIGSAWWLAVMPAAALLCIVLIVQAFSKVLGTPRTHRIEQEAAK